MKTRTLTLAKLRKIGACESALDKFRALFGESVEVTEQLAVEHAGAFDFDFAARLLSAEGQDEYERQEALLLAEYRRQEAPLLAEYVRQEAPLLAEYVRQEAPLRDEYERQKAQLWARLYVGGRT